MLAEGARALSRQMSIEQQAVTGVVAALMLEEVKKWRVANKAGLVVARSGVLDAGPDADITAAVIAAMNTRTPEFAALPVVNVTRPAPPARGSMPFLRIARSSGDISWLASPATGGGVPVGRFEQLFLLGLEDGGASPKGLVVFAWERLDAQGQKLLRDGAALETPQDNVAELARQATDFVQTRLPLLRALGVTAGR